jgi:hypothetical protein
MAVKMITQHEAQNLLGEDRFHRLLAGGFICPHRKGYVGERQVDYGQDMYPEGYLRFRLEEDERLAGGSPRPAADPPSSKPLAVLKSFCHSSSDEVPPELQARLKEVAGELLRVMRDALSTVRDEALREPETV